MATQKINSIILDDSAQFYSLYIKDEDGQELLAVQSFPSHQLRYKGKEIAAEKLVELLKSADKDNGNGDSFKADQ